MPRRKITDPTPDGMLPQLPNGADLPELTEKQFAYVRHLIAGQRDIPAYRMAYDAQNMTDNTVMVEAWRLKKNPKIAAWLNAAREMQLQQVSVSLDSHIARLDYLSRMAERSGNLGAAIQAEMLKGKVAGHYVERHEDVGKSRAAPDSLIKRLRKAGMDDTALGQLAKALGIKTELPVTIDAKPVTATVQ